MSDWDETFSDYYISISDESNTSSSYVSGMFSESDFLASSFSDDDQTDIVSLIESQNSESAAYSPFYEPESEADSNNQYMTDESDQASQYECYDNEEEDRHIFTGMRDTATNDASDNLNANNNNNCNTNLECKICFQSSIPNEPTMTLCGHVFCKICIGRALERKKECPICRKKLKFKDVNRIYL